MVIDDNNKHTLFHINVGSLLLVIHKINYSVFYPVLEKLNYNLTD